MSAVVGLFGDEPGSTTDAIVQRMLAIMADLGTEHDVVRPAPGITLAVARHPWERAPGLAGTPLVVRDGNLVVAADASLYYPQTFEDRLAARGVRPSGRSPGHRILDAYRAWGDQCGERLEGDYAFVIADLGSGDIVVGRDPFGRRALYHARLGRTLVVASRVDAVLAHPACSRELRLEALGAAAANLNWSHGSDTCYAHVDVVPMAHVVGLGRRRFEHRHWTPIADDRGARQSREDAAGELREALTAAVLERLAHAGPTAVWMSGGRDSTAVFAAGRAGLEKAGDERELLPVSIHYPEGDTGHEDPYIEAVARFWRAPVHWLDSTDIAMFEDEAAWAAQRDEPARSPYDHWNAALAAGSRAIGARVALDGNGGDQLFTGTPVFLADRLRSGRWWDVARRLRRAPRGQAWLWTLQPSLADGWRRLLPRVPAPAPARHYLEASLPPWIRRSFVRRYGLVERQRAHLPPTSHPRGRAATELEWTLSVPLYGYAHASMQPRLLATGVELRSPLLDTRVVAVALRRPALERCTGGEYKPLLAAAMRGLIPAEVLAPRPEKSGLTVSFSKRCMRTGLPQLWQSLSGEPWVLEELGIVDADALKSAVTAFREDTGQPHRVELFHTLQLELWLRVNGARSPGRH